jgi:5'-nucleotidase
MRTEWLPSEAVVAAALPVAQLTPSVTPSSAAPLEAVPVSSSAAGGIAGGDGDPPPPPRAASAEVSQTLAHCVHSTGNPASSWVGRSPDKPGPSVQQQGAPPIIVRMPVSLAGQLVVAISSRALFDLEEENRVFEASDDRGYMALQLERLATAAAPGVAFSLVNKLLAFNAGGAARVEVVILSRNDPVSGMRVFRSAQHYAMPILRGVFTRGEPPWRYLRPLAANLFLSTNEADVRSALDAGVPAARVYPQSARASDAHPHEVRIAFDGDAVLFSDEAERVYQRAGLDALQDHERDRAATPLAAGPFKPLLEALHRMQQEPAGDMRIRTALVTARSAPAHERAIRTLMQWNIVVDEAMFLGGLPKGEFLREFEPDFFFDDQTGHVENAAPHVPAGHVASR